MKWGLVNVKKSLISLGNNVIGFIIRYRRVLFATLLFVASIRNMIIKILESSFDNVVVSAVYSEILDNYAFIFATGAGIGVVFAVCFGFLCLIGAYIFFLYCDIIVCAIRHRNHIGLFFKDVFSRGE